MYNSRTYNGILYNNVNDYIVTGTVLPSDFIHFNGFGLSNDYIVVTTINKDGFPDRAFQTYENPNRHGETSYQDLFRRKVITVTGYIIRDTVANLESYLVTFLQKMGEAEKWLYITFGGRTTRYKCTVINRGIIDRASYHLDYVPFTLEFLCIEPFGESTNITSVFESNATGNQIDVLMTNTGIFPTYLESVMLVNSASGFTGITITNVTTGKSASVTGTFVGGDYITFQGNVTKNTNGTLSGKSVDQNGTVLYHTGTIPDLEIGNNLIRYNFTSVSHDINISTNTRLKY